MYECDGSDRLAGTTDDVSSGRQSLPILFACILSAVSDRQFS